MVVNTITQPKKTLTSNKWIRRNDSTSVSILLQPDSLCKPQTNRHYKLQNESNSEITSSDSEDDQPRRVILSEPPKTQTEHKIYKTFCPDCYCKSFPITPCMGNPHDSCCCKEQQRQKQRTRSAPCQQRSVKPQQRKFRECNNGIYTKRREYYEMKSKDYFTTLKRRLEEMELELKREQEEIERKKDEYRSLQQKSLCYEQRANECYQKSKQSKLKEPTKQPKQPKQTKHNKQNTKQKQNPTKIKEIMSFRKANYFACHSSATSLDSVQNGPHQHQQTLTSVDEREEEPSPSCSSCLHKCYLSNNLKLIAKNQDEYGTSRCYRCQKHLSQTTLTSPPTDNHTRSLLFDKASMKHLSLIPLDAGTDNDEYEDYAYLDQEGEELLQDKMFLTTKQNEQLEVTLPHNFLREVRKEHSPKTLSMLQTKTFKNFKVPVPGDSMALRYQKGMMNRNIAS